MLIQSLRGHLICQKLHISNYTGVSAYLVDLYTSGTPVPTILGYAAPPFQFSKDYAVASHAERTRKQRFCILDECQLANQTPFEWRHHPNGDFNSSPLPIALSPKTDRRLGGERVKLIRDWIKIASASGFIPTATSGSDPGFL